MPDDNITVNNQGGDLNSFLNAVGGGLSELGDHAANGSLNNADLAIAYKGLGARLGYATDGVDLANATTSDNPEYEIPKVISKLFGSRAGAIVGGFLGGAIVGSKIQNPVAIGFGIFAGAIYGSYYGSEKMGEFFDEYFKDGGVFDQTMKPYYGTLPNITISNPTVHETDKKAVFVIKLDQPAKKDLRLKIFSEGSDKSAGLVVGNTNETATNGKDYIVNTHYITIPAGTSEYIYEAEILNDNEVEKDEFFKLYAVVDNPKDFGANEHFNYVKTATCTIKDGKLHATISDITINEADGVATFTLSIDRPVDEDLTFYASTISGKNKNRDAIADKDYVSFNDKKVIIYAGQTSATIEVNITDDDFNENDEIFGLWLSPDYKHIKDYKLETLYQATATIIDDDNDIVGVSIEDKTLQEGDEKCYLDKIAVTLSRELKDNETISVNFGNQTLEFSASSDTTLYYDFEHDGNFSVNAQKFSTHTLSPTITSSNVNAKLTKDGIITIQDDDNPVYVIIKGNSTSEKSEKLKGSVSLSRSLKEGEYVNVSVAGKIIEFTSANSSEEFKITWTDDKTEEEDSKFYITPSYISSNSTVYFKGKGGKCVIIDDDKDKDPNDPKNYDPIIIDLNKNGIIETTNIDYGRRFDLDNNGFKESLAWVGKADALLAIDKNGNGIIDNGSELFTNANHTNGFENLKSYDTNNDGIIDSKDEIWNNLILWQDKDENAQSNKNELTYIKDTDIASINLAYTNTNQTNNANKITQLSTITHTDGTTSQIADVNLSVDYAKSSAPEIEVSDEILELPNVEGMGNIYDLHIAMQLNPALKQAVQNYINLSNEDRKKEIKNLVYKWIGVDNNAKFANLNLFVA